MNTRSYRQAYDDPSVLDVPRRRRVKWHGRPRVLTDAERAVRSADRQELLQRQRTKRLSAQHAQMAIPLPVPHQFIPSIPAPLAGSIALKMYLAPRRKEEDLARVDVKC